MCCSAVNDGSCSPWVMSSSSVVRGNQIRDTVTPQDTSGFIECKRPTSLYIYIFFFFI